MLYLLYSYCFLNVCVVFNMGFLPISDKYIISKVLVQTCYLLLLKFSYTDPDNFDVHI